MSGCELVLAGGHEGRAERFDGAVLSLVCDLAFAPGQPIVATLRAGDSSLEVRGKTVSSKRRQDGGFDVRVRLHSVRREDRSWLEQHLPNVT